MTNETEPPQTRTAAGQQPIRRTLLLASLFALILFVLITIVVATSSAVQGSIGPTGVGALLFFVGFTLVAALATNEVIPWCVRDLDQWLQPKVLGAFASALVVAAGALFSLLPLLHSPNSQADERTSASIERLRQDIETSGRSSGGATTKRFSLLSSAPVFNGLGSSYRLTLLDSLGSDTELNCRISILDENIAPYLNAVAKSCADMSISLGLTPLPASFKSGTKYEYSLDTGVRIDIEEVGGRKHQLDEFVSFNDNKPPVRFKDQTDGVSSESNNGIFGPKETAFGSSAIYTVWSPPGYVCDWSDNSPFFHSQTATGSCSTVVEFTQDNPKIPSGINRKTVAGHFTGTLQVTVRSKQHGIWRKTSRPISTNIPDSVIRRWLYWYAKAPHKTPSDRIRASLTSTGGPKRLCKSEGVFNERDNRKAFERCQCAHFQLETRGYEEFDWEFMRPENCE